MSITIPAYLQMFEDLAVHQWLESTIREFPIPGPETTLGEMARNAEPLNQAITAIQYTEQPLGRIDGFVGGHQDRERVSHH